MHQISLPKNYDENNPEFEIFENLQPEVSEPAKITKLQNYRVSNNGVIFRYFEILRESCISQGAFDKYNTGYKFFLKYIFPHFNFSKKKHFLIIFDEWNDNYYHWHLYAIYRLMILKEAGLLENAKILLPKKYLKIPFITQSLLFFGVDKKQLVFIRRKSNIKVKTIYTCKTFNKIDETLRLQNFLKDKVEPNKEFGDKIYISRRDTKYRYFVNEDEVSALLEKYGFKALDTSNLSYAEQVAIFKNAKYVVGAHGAGLTNIFFMNAGGRLLEIATRSTQGNKPVTDYFKLSSRIGIDYYYHQCQPHGVVAGYQEWQEGLIADINKLEKDVKLMCEF